MNFKEQIIRGSSILEEGKFDDTERKKWLNGSEAMTCIRKQWYAKNDAPQADQDWGFARRGSHGEKFIVESLIAANVPLAYAGADQQTWKDEKRSISSTPDGILQYDDEWIVPEFKTIDPRTNKGKLPKPAHITQLEIAMAMIDQKIDRPDHVKLRGVLVYMDASNYYDVIQFDVPFNAGILDNMAKRAAKIFRTKDVANLDREGKRDGGNECKTMCPYTKVCGVTMEADADRGKANKGSQLDGSAAQYMALSDTEATIKSQKATLREDILKELHKRNAKTLIVGGLAVSVSVAKGRASLNRKAVAAAGIDLSPFETIGQPSERLTVKRA